jgi:hydrogenase maturation protease
MPTTYVLGLGNVLMGDDGVGPAVLRAFDEQYVVGPAVSIVDLGTPGLDLSPWLADVDRVILVDAVQAPLPPGSVRLYLKHDLLQEMPTVRTSPHDPGVRETLLALEFAGRAPREVTLIGVVPARAAMSLDLSPEVASAIPAAVRAVVEALERFGVDVQSRPHPLRHVPWWARAAAAGNPA